MTISEQAACKGKELIAAQATGMADPGLRVRVVGGGCSGLMYQLELGDGARDGDEVFERDGFRVYIDRKSLFFLNGSELDYRDGLTGAGFRFSNPNVTGTCGCGESFSV
ncbi:MAG: HesB/IscA family protein [Planctomycetota bacterium]